MEDYKEFTGKNLDDAMAAACDYFGLERGKLEIEILSDAKSGIFGLVGAKKAIVRARKATIDIPDLKVGVKEGEKKPQPQSVRPRKEKAAPAPTLKEKAPPMSAPKPEAVAPAAPAAGPEKPAAPAAQASKPRRRPENTQEARPEQQGDKRQNGKNRARNKGEKNAKPRPELPKAPRPGKDALKEHEGVEEKFPETPLESLDPARLEAEVLAAVDSMTRHIVGESEKSFEIAGSKARVRIDSEEDSGLLIGRDGQTLSALQYLASCIVSRRLGVMVRVQIDAGDYRNRQLEKLRDMVMELSEKVKETGKPQSTRPMSAYLRRIVHMALQEDPDVQTHSTGEGSLKRVVIVPRKK